MASIVGCTESHSRSRGQGAGAPTREAITVFDGGAMRQRVQFVGTEEHMQRMGVFGAAVVLIGLVDCLH